jgi:hypothetical protein
MVIGILRIDLYMNGNRSLKAKRQILKSLIQRVKSRYNNVSISEVGSHDLWQKATIGISFVGNESVHRNDRGSRDGAEGIRDNTFLGDRFGVDSQEVAEDFGRDSEGSVRDDSKR